MTKNLCIFPIPDIWKKIRDAFDFGGTPLKFIVRERGEKE